jgi:hypothetical protein
MATNEPPAHWPADEWFATPAIGPGVVGRTTLCAERDRGAAASRTSPFDLGPVVDGLVLRDVGRVAIQASTLQQSCALPLPIGALGINARNLAARAGRSRSVPIRRTAAPAPIHLAWGSSWAISPNSAICCPRASPVEALTTPRLSITDPARTNSLRNSALERIESSADRSP